MFLYMSIQSPITPIINSVMTLFALKNPKNKRKHSLHGALVCLNVVKVVCSRYLVCVKGLIGHAVDNF